MFPSNIILYLGGRDIDFRKSGENPDRRTKFYLLEAAIRKLRNFTRLSASSLLFPETGNGKSLDANNFLSGARPSPVLARACEK